MTKSTTRDKLIVELYSKCREELRIYALRFCSDLVSEDIVHQAFVNSYDKLSEELSPQQQKSYLYTAVRNLCLNAKRDSKISYSDAALSMVTEMVVIDSHAYLYEIIGRLPKREKDIILLSLQGYSSKEIAESLNIEYNTVKHYKKEAYAKIRVILSPELNEILSDS